MDPKKTTPQLLVDTRSIRLALVEADDSGKVRVRGEFARAGEATENKRVYPKKVWEREIGRLGGAMKERRVFGELDHPVDGRTSLNRVSHIVTSMQLDDGVLVGEAEILPTDKGRNLMTLLKSGCKVGVSSRGFGSTKANDKGEEIVQEDYRLVTFDFVADPADQTAYPEVFFEGVEIEHMLTKEQEAEKAKQWADQIQAAADSAEKGATEDSKVKLADEVLTQIASMKDQLRNEIRGEMLSDPQVAGARAAVEQIMNILRPFVLPEDAEAVVRGKEAEIGRLKKELADRDLKIKDLETDNAKLGEAAKEAGYRLYLERQLAKDPDADLIKKTIGDVKKFESADELKARLAGVREELAKKREESKKADAEKSREVREVREQLRASQEKADEKIETIKEALEKALSANKILGLQLYVEKKLQNHPRAAKIRSLIESAKPDSTQAVDKIFENQSTPAPKDGDEADSVRARVRRMNRGGFETDVKTEEEPSVPLQEANYNGLGIDLGELKRLSGQQ